jgi:hypothetical protein
MLVARHLWEAGAPYFNISEPVMASTAPRWIILTSPGSLRFHPLEVSEQRPTGFHGGVPARFIQESLPVVIIGLRRVHDRFHELTDL